MKRYQYVFCGVLVCLMQVLARGVDDIPNVLQKPKLPEGTPAEQVSKLDEQHADARGEFQKRFEAAATPEEQNELAPHFPNPNDYAVLFLQIAETHPNEPAAVDALLWVVRNVRDAPGSTDTPYAKARAVLVRDHLNHPKIASFCFSLQNTAFDTEAISILRRVQEKHPDKEVQAKASYALARLLLNRAQWGDSLNVNDDETRQRAAAVSKFYRLEAVSGVKEANPEQQRKEAEALLEQLTKNERSAATSVTRDGIETTLGHLAKRQLFELRHLQPGKPAPEVTGDGIDGKAMKLSDFRGTVVVLSFWASWCGPCMAQVPHERELVARMKDRPFSLVGVNGDMTRKAAQKVAKEMKMTWPSFWHKTSDGSIADLWNVDTWPTGYLIDHQGIIVKMIDVNVKADEGLIEQKVKEAEAARK